VGATAVTEGGGVVRRQTGAALYQQQHQGRHHLNPLLRLGDSELAKIALVGRKARERVKDLLQHKEPVRWVARKHGANDVDGGQLQRSQQRRLDEEHWQTRGRQLDQQRIGERLLLHQRIETIEQLADLCGDRRHVECRQFTPCSGRCRSSAAGGIGSGDSGRGRGRGRGILSIVRQENRRYVMLNRTNDGLDRLYRCQYVRYERAALSLSLSRSLGRTHMTV